MASERSDVMYGPTHELFVTRKVGGESFVIGGTAQDNTQWTRVLTPRAAQLLWHQLLQHLFPEKAEKVKSIAVTAPMRDANLPTVTAHTLVKQRDDGSFRIAGWAGESTWQADLSPMDAQRFWALLDTALYPTGWQG